MSGLLLLRRRVPAILRCSRSLQARHYGLLGKPGKKVLDLHALPQTPARTRFAPSPTGYLHLGSIRTALYNYLLARATGGQFIIRLEDTDQTRFVADAEQKLYDDLKWAGMDWDEGPDKGGKFGPYKQSERLGLYAEHAEKLLDNGHAFRCFCPNKPAGESTGESEVGWGTGYPGTCKHIPRSESDRRAANGEPHVIRFNSSKEQIEYVDVVYGLRRVKSSDNDPIIIKTDGFPTYHFANIVDDHHMDITHVIRGAEWLVSTPLHIEMYQAFQWKPPSFGHVGLLVDQQRQKLSKRDRENIGVSVFRSNHILPQALMNFAIHLGWNPQLAHNPHLRKDGVMTMKKMQDNFSMKFTRGDIVVDLTKLKFFQAKWTKDLITGVIDDPSTLDEHFVKPITAIVQRVEKTLYVQHQFESERKRKQTPPPVPATEAAYLEDLGIKIENHQSLTYQFPKWSVKKHVLAILKAAKGKVQTPEQFVRDCKYAFFAPKMKALADSAHVLEPDFTQAKVYLRRREDKKEEEEREKGAPVTIDRVMQIFQTHLINLKRVQPTKRGKNGKELPRPKKEFLPIAEWTADRINTDLSVVADTLRAVFYKHGTAAEDATAPWRYLKWACLCGQPESEHISISKLLEAWGPDRSATLLKRAKKAAELIEKQHTKQRRKEMREKKLHGEVMRRLDINLKKTHKAKELLAHEEEDEEDEDEDEDKVLRRALRGAHRKGPFASKTVPHLQLAAAENKPTYKERTSPTDVDRFAQILKPSEFKESTRHLTESHVQEAAVFNGRLPIGEIPHALGEESMRALEEASAREQAQAEQEVRERCPWYLPDRDIEEALPPPTNEQVHKPNPLGSFLPPGATRRSFYARQIRLAATRREKELVERGLLGVVDRIRARFPRMRPFGALDGESPMGSYDYAQHASRFTPPLGIPKRTNDSSPPELSAKARKEAEERAEAIKLAKGLKSSSDVQGPLLPRAQFSLLGSGWKDNEKENKEQEEKQDKEEQKE